MLKVELRARRDGILVATRDYKVGGEFEVDMSGKTPVLRITTPTAALNLAQAAQLAADATGRRR